MAEEKMERVVLSEEELDKTVGGIIHRPRVKRRRYQPPFQRTGGWGKDTTSFAENNAADTYSNDQGNTD